MPYIHIRTNTSLNDTQRQQLQTQTTTLMHTVMGKRAEVTVVQITTSEPAQWSINSTALQPDMPSAAYVDIKITEGTNTSAQKAKMLADTIAMLRAVIGTLQEACYVVIDEVPADSWGYSGISQAERAVAVV